MKKIVLDIETTGLNWKNNNRIIEICCIELKKNRLSKNCFHEYINPEKVIIDNEAYKIHGITNSFLKDKPLFKNIVEKFLSFIFDSILIIHNADFDVNFINYELKKIGLKNINFYCKKIVDTLELAKKIFPGKRNSLDFLSKRFKINIDRKFHSAILDVKLLAKIYYYLTIKQNYLFLGDKKKYIKNIGFNNIVCKASQKDLIMHNIFLKKNNLV